MPVSQGYLDLIARDQADMEATQRQREAKMSVAAALAKTLREMPWTASTPAQKRRARAMAKRGEARITEMPANYIGRRGLVVSTELLVEPIKENANVK